MNILKEIDFDKAVLKNIGNEYYPVYSWIWNDEIDANGIVQRLDDMQRVNIKNIYVIAESKNFRPGYMPTYLNPDYLSTDYLKLFDFAVREASKRGMQLWIYDEDGWPSGSCSGKTAVNDSSLRLHKMTYSRTDDNDENKISFDHYDASGEKHYPNLMLKESTKAFVEATHKQYAKLSHDMFGETIQAVFTDEPFIDFHIYDERVYEGFFKKYGYRIEEHKEALFDELECNDEDSKKARVDFYEYCTELFAVNYFADVAKWCHENKLLFTGHINGDDSAEFVKCCGNVLRVLREMDIPGVDVIYRQIFPHEPSVDKYTLGNDTFMVETCGNMFFPRFASSVAHTMKNRRALAECFAVYGGGMSFDEMRYVINFLAVRGINLFNIMNIPYGSHGHICGGMRPSFTPNMPAYEGLKSFNDYIAALSYVLSCGQPDIRQAVYMPVRAWWSSKSELENGGKAFENLGRSIEAHGADFDIIDDDDILSDRACSYNQIFISGWIFHKDGVKEKLEKFIRDGKKVYTTIPTDICGAQRIQTEDAGMLAEKLIKISPCGNIRTTVRNLKDGAKLIFLYNEGFSGVSADIQLGNWDSVYEIDLQSGCILESKNNLHLELISGQGKVYIVGRAYSTPYDSENYKNELELTGFEVRRISRFRVDNAVQRKEILNEPFVPISEEKLDLIFSDNFSGSAIYRTHFNWNGGSGKLVIENVHICCSVSLNNRTVTEKPLVFSPFEVDLSDFLIKGENVIEITVSNTVADEICNVEFPNEYIQGSYHEMTLPLEKQAIGGGISGKVKIMY